MSVWSLQVDSRPWSDYDGHVRVPAGVSVWLRGINPWNKTIEDITQGLQRRREVLEREVVHADRVGLHRQAIEREWSRCTIIFFHLRGALTGTLDHR